MSSKRDWTTLEEVHPTKPYTIKWYTDGTLTNQGTGLGVVDPRVSYHEFLGTDTSIFQAEIYTKKQ
ncbi:GH23933 [Drosophila grimshawi]|uniref:GH23933 n=1 Tax=Drosophila grimshawi TaxID=7222 RepID=B4JZU5_DROGR|nr:GH23933 [Drosophila grimshawi]